MRILGIYKIVVMSFVGVLLSVVSWGYLKSNAWMKTKI